ncbi:MAG TPA: hypothetical protein VHZ95_14880, partial [Polyangiales bacterium]|nr:hypothetical protein [Polyangiales bacterium]
MRRGCADRKDTWHYAGMSMSNPTDRSWKLSIVGACALLLFSACSSSGGAVPALGAAAGVGASAAGTGSTAIITTPTPTTPTASTLPTSGTSAAISGSGAAGTIASADSGADDDAGAIPTDAGTSIDAGATINADAGSIFNLFPPPVDAGPAPTMTDGGLTCENLACFDIFDCLLYHPVE